MRKLIIAAVVVIVLAWTASPMLQIIAQKRELARLEKKLVTLRAENRHLKEEIKRFNDPDFIEVLAREKLGLVKEGQRSYVVIPPREITDDASEEASSEATGDAKGGAGGGAGATPDEQGSSSVAASPQKTKTDGSLLDRVLRFLGLIPPENG